MKTLAFSSTQSACIWRRTRWTLFPLACACLAASAQVSAINPTFQPNPTDRSNPQFTPSHLTALNASTVEDNDAALNLDRSDRASFNDGSKITLELPLLSQTNALCPLVGLLAAIGFTYILRRRRIAQLAAIGISQR